MSAAKEYRSSVETIDDFDVLPKKGQLIFMLPPEDVEEWMFTYVPKIGDKMKFNDKDMFIFGPDKHAHGGMIAFLRKNKDVYKGNLFYPLELPSHSTAAMALSILLERIEHDNST